MAPIIDQDKTNLAADDPDYLEEAKKHGGEWYVVHTYSGYENKIKVDLAKRIESMHMQDKIFDIIIPEEQEYEYKNGKKKLVTRRVFPGYVMVNMILNDESWYVVHHTPGVTGFVSSGTKPIPLQEDEIGRIFKRIGLKDKVSPIIDVRIGENIKVHSGPFENFEGVVKEIYPERAKLKVNISMFGRETPVELEYEQIEKL